MNICNMTEISNFSDCQLKMESFTWLSAYTQPGGGLLKPKHVHAAGFCTSKIQVMFSRYSGWFDCLVT